MSAYLAILRMKFAGGLQYRAAALAGLATQFAWGFMELLAFSAFFRANPAGFPMSFEQMVSYIWLQQALLALFMTWFIDRDIFDAILFGSIAYELVRPIDLYGRWFAQSVANRLSRAVLRCIPVLIVAFLLPEPMRMSAPASLLQLLLFFLSMGLSLVVVVSFSMLIYVSAFYTLSPAGVRLMATVAADFLAGGTIPLPFFPPVFRSVAELLPFAAMQNMPLRIYSSHIVGMEMVRGISLQIFWAAILIGIGRILMKRATKRVIVQGG